MGIRDRSSTGSERISRQTYYRWQKRVFEATQSQRQVEFAETKTFYWQLGEAYMGKPGLAVTVRSDVYKRQEYGLSQRIER